MFCYINQQTVTTATGTTVATGAADTVSDNVQNNIISKQTDKVINKYPQIFVFQHIGIFKNGR